MDGQRIGTVEDLVIDTEVMRVRYIEGKLELAEAAPTRKLGADPIADARLDEDEDDGWWTIRARSADAHATVSRYRCSRAGP
jgi:hypothetical protein